MNLLFNEFNRGIKNGFFGDPLDSFFKDDFSQNNFRNISNSGQINNLDQGSFGLFGFPGIFGMGSNMNPGLDNFLNQPSYQNNFDHYNQFRNNNPNYIQNNNVNFENSRDQKPNIKYRDNKIYDV